MTTLAPADHAQRLDRRSGLPDSPEPTAAQARAVGITGNRRWPYGPDGNRASRAAMVRWASAYGLKLSGSDAVCPRWLERGRCMYRTCEWLDTPGWADHLTGWTWNGRPALLVAHPYGLFPRDLAALAALHAERGLDVSVDGTGWYGHGTTMVEVWAPDVREAAHRALLDGKGGR